MSIAPQASDGDLRTRAEALGQTLPPLLAEAEMLASTVMMGEHGRRRAGLGDEFWQYRPAHQGDSARMIDWRRSARSDAHFVREREWQAAQSVTIWVDPAKSMSFTGDRSRAPKSDRAKLLGLALAVLLLRGGERVGLAGLATPRAGRTQLRGWRRGCPGMRRARIMALRKPRGWSATGAVSSCRISWAIWRASMPALPAPPTGGSRAC